MTDEKKEWEERAADSIARRGGAESALPGPHLKQPSTSLLQLLRLTPLLGSQFIWSD